MRFHVFRSTMKRLLPNKIALNAGIAIILFLLIPPFASAADIMCEGAYGGHLQGIALEPNTAIYWSFTVTLVKTDMRGHVLKSLSVPSHHGDLTFWKGKVYVAVNLGAFNREPGYADSWVYVYDADDLTLLSRHKIPEAVHGAGGMTCRKGHFFIVGGLPPGYTENYVYEYSGDFKFIRRHTIASGYTRMGIQTVTFFRDRFWFGCYGKPDNKPLFVTDTSFRIIAESETDFSVGIAGMKGLTFLRGATKQDETSKTWTGWVETVKSESAPKKGAILEFQPY